VQLEHDVDLAGLTTLELGGRARYLVRAESESDVALALDFARDRRAPVWVLGGGSNVIVPDGGLDGLVLLIRLRGVDVRIAEAEGAPATVTAKAGEPWDALVAAMVERGLAGIECLSGIPGLVGATPIQNVGAYGQEVSDTIDSVRAYDREDRRFVELSGPACEFSYRDSLFKSRQPGRHVVTAVRFALKPGAPPTLRYPELRQRFGGTTPSLVEVRSTVLTIRRAKSMVVEASDENRRSCGSFFLNPVVSARIAEETAQRFPGAEMPRYPQPDGQLKLSAAWLIERSGIHKGLRSGNVAVSSRHALALVCRDGATSHELLSFADEIRARVAERTGIALAIEPVRF
jgi:UDP-N-acetylmuramate dehydrogenase